VGVWPRGPGRREGAISRGWGPLRGARAKCGALSRRRGAWGRGPMPPRSPGRGAWWGGHFCPMRCRGGILEGYQTGPVGWAGGILPAPIYLAPGAVRPRGGAGGAARPPLLLSPRVSLPPLPARPGPGSGCLPGLAWSPGKLGARPRILEGSCSLPRPCLPGPGLRPSTPEPRGVKRCPHACTG